MITEGRPTQKLGGVNVRLTRLGTPVSSCLHVEMVGLEPMAYRREVPIYEMYWWREA